MQDPLLNSLVYVSKYYGLLNSPETLINGFPLQEGKLTPSLIPRVADRAGLTAQEQHQDLEAISTLVLPVILLLKDNQSCVLLAFDKDKQQAEVVYNHEEVKRISHSELSKQFSGRFFLLKKKYHFDDRSPDVLMDNKSNWFWGTIKKSTSIYRDILIASILINLFALAIPLFTRIVYDKVIPNLAFHTLWVLASGMAIIFLFDLLLKTLRSYFIDLACKKSDILISAQIFSQVLGIKMSAKPNSVGAFVKQLQEFESIKEFLASATITSLVDLPFALLFLFIIWIIAGPLVIIPIIGICALIIYSLSIQKPIKKTIEEGSRLASQKSADLFESVAGLETVKSFNAQSKFQFRWEETSTHMANWSIKSRRLTDGIQNFAGVIQNFSAVSVIIFGVYAIANGDLSMGSLIATSMLCSRAIAPMVQLSVLSTRYNQAKSSLIVIDQMMQLPTEQETNKHYIHPTNFNGQIDIDNVNFTYPEAKILALRNVSIGIKPGEKIAIIGKIGSGKSTLLKLIMKLYQPDEGNIRLDSTDIEQLHHVDIRKNIGFVPQDTLLFYGSIRQNIALGHTHINNDETLLAANKAGVSLFCQQDSDGLERQVGEGGYALSGGQRQAVALARAFLGDPNVYLMDEPTSAMDNSLELHIKQQLLNLRENQTLILCTHKMSMLSVVDRLIVMEQGTIVADGPKNKVLTHLKNLSEKSAKGQD